LGIDIETMADTIVMLTEVPNVLGYILENFFKFFANLYNGYIFLIAVLTIASIMMIYFKFMKKRLMVEGFG